MPKELAIHIVALLAVGLLCLLVLSDIWPLILCLAGGGIMMKSCTRTR